MVYANPRAGCAIYSFVRRRSCAHGKHTTMSAKPSGHFTGTRKQLGVEINIFKTKAMAFRNGGFLAQNER